MKSTLAKTSLQPHQAFDEPMVISSSTSYGITSPSLLDKAGRIAMSVFFFILGILVMLKIFHGF